MKLVRQQCVLHPDRGAVARCPECGRFYCHECITEHEGEVLCRRCLLRQSDKQESSSGFWKRHGTVLKIAFKPILAVAGFFLLWLLFVAVGSLLMHFPDSFYYIGQDSAGERGALRK